MEVWSPTSTTESKDGPLSTTTEETEQISDLYEEQQLSFNFNIWSSSKLPFFVRDPADSFIFLARFIGDVGLVRSFESDAVLDMLRKATLERLRGHIQSRHIVASPVEPPGLLQDSASSPIRTHSTALDDGSARPSLMDDLDRPPAIEHTVEMRQQKTPVSDLEQSTSWQSDVLATKLSELVSCLRLIVIETSPSIYGPTVSWSPQMEAICFEFFSPPKVRIFLEAYWSIWSPNCPIIHRPTFDPLLTPVTLLSAMILMGAGHSPSAADRMNARFWYDHVEEMVFRNPFLTLALSINGTRQMSDNSKRRTVQAIQAAYTVCICQNWDGSLSTRMRIRRRRFGDIITVLHVLTRSLWKCVFL